MDTSVIQQQLRDIGMTDKESGIYLNLLELGEATAGEVAQNAQLNRVTVYGILEEMVMKGQVFHTNSEGVKRYGALSPQIIIDEAKSRIQTLEQNLPLLMSLQGDHKQKPRTRFYDGLKGLKKAYQDTLDCKTEMLNYANSKRLLELWPTYRRDYVLKRVEKGIHLRGVYPDVPKGRSMQRFDKEFIRETRLLDESYFSDSYETKIFDNRILLAAFDPEPFAILIESPVLYNTQKQIFELVWRGAKIDV